MQETLKDIRDSLDGFAQLIKDFIKTIMEFADSFKKDYTANPDNFEKEPVEYNN